MRFLIKLCSNSVLMAINNFNYVCFANVHTVKGLFTTNTVAQVVKRIMFKLYTLIKMELGSKFYK